VCGGEECVVQHYELGRSGAAAMDLRREFHQRRNQVSILKQPQLVRHRFQCAAVLKLSLQFLQGHDLGR
jgi:hypothetical protein